MKISRFLTAGALSLGIAITALPAAQAAKFSSTKIEVLHGNDYERNDRSQSILTFANASGFEYGDTFIFADYGDWLDTDETDGIHSELSGRLSLLRTFGEGDWGGEGAIKDIYLITQFDITGNRFATQTVPMFGVSVDWNLPGFIFFKTHIQYRDDPVLDDSGTQFNLVWLKNFNIGEAKFSFEGFLDYTTDIGNRVSNTLAQPVIVYHVNDSVAVGVEYQYWENRLGFDGRDESTAQALARWKF